MSDYTSHPTTVSILLPQHWHHSPSGHTVKPGDTVATCVPLHWILAPWLFHAFEHSRYQCLCYSSPTPYPGPSVLLYVHIHVRCQICSNHECTICCIKYQEGFFQAQVPSWGKKRIAAFTGEKLNCSYHQRHHSLGHQVFPQFLPMVISGEIDAQRLHNCFLPRDRTTASHPQTQQ